MARLVLVGMPGVGKSTVARALARQWHCRALDTDDLVAALVGTTAAAYLRDEGEATFREREVDALTDALARDDVVATGGGVVTTERARTLLEGEVTLWLDCDDDVLMARLDDVERPLIGRDVRSSLVRLREERDEWYAAVSVGRVDASGTVDDVVTRVNDQLGRLST